MGLHSNTVLKNSCLKVPVDPVNKLPSASYERRRERRDEKYEASPSSNLNKSTSKSIPSLGDFYKSIPDYRDLTHLSSQEFYRRLDKLRECRHRLLLNMERPTPMCVVDDFSTDYLMKNPTLRESSTPRLDKYAKNVSESDFDSVLSEAKPPDADGEKKCGGSPKSDHLYLPPNKLNIKANSPSCSVSWNDVNTPRGANVGGHFKLDGASKRSVSVPTSPVKRRQSSPAVSTLFRRDYDSKILSKLKDYTNELEYKYLEKDKHRKQFRANPVPIESRIPLYEKILEDQELRRAISKLQSTAELQAQIKPFSFTEREEKYGHLRKFGCSRLSKSNPQLNTLLLNDDFYQPRTFKAKPIPKHLFSNYIYEKMREEEFYRSLNRKIRAEELLKTASLPPSMAKREKRNKQCDSPSCQKYHNDIDLYQFNNTGGFKGRKKMKSRKKRSADRTEESDGINGLKYNLSPVSKSEKNSQEENLRKIYGSNSSDTVTPSSGYCTRPRSAVDINSVNRSNLAAILRIESSKKKLEAEVLKQLEEDRFQSEMKWRDSVLRRKPAWKSLKYSHTDELAMRLQTRRDEERLKRERFMHDMETMYGRVHNQPMMFERTYSPRKYYTHITPNQYHEVQPNERRRTNKASSSQGRRFLMLSSPTRSRKVSINETAETIGDDIDDFLYKSDDDDDDDGDGDDDDDVPEHIEH